MDSRIYILTHKRLTGQLSSVETAELNRLSLIPENQALSEEISYLWNVSNNYFPTKDWKKDDAKQAFMQKINTIPPKVAPVSSTNSTSTNWGRVIGAIAAIFLLSMSLFYFFNKKEVITAKEKIEYAEIMDNTKIWLNQGAKITVLEESPNLRRVALQGEAFFDISHDEQRPFSIELGNNIFVEVLGTSFKAISTHQDGSCMISVREGRVRMFSTADAEHDIVLSAGEEGSFDPSYGLQRSRSISIKPMMTNDSEIVFKNAPLYEVFDKLGMHYGVNISYDKTAVDCRFTANIPDDDDLSQILASVVENYKGLSVKVLKKSKIEVSGSCK